MKKSLLLTPCLFLAFIANCCTVAVNVHGATCYNSCNGSATAAPVGVPPYTYVWSPGGQTTQTITGLCRGTYTVTVTDALGCQASAAATVGSPPQINLVTNGYAASCYGYCDGGANAQATGGVPPFTYLWSPGGQTAQTIYAQCAGNYTITVTDNAGCTASRSVAITQPDAVIISFFKEDVTCFQLCNGNVTGWASGGTPPYSYSWNNGSTSHALSGLCAGSYTLTVTDYNGCTGSNVVTITEPALLQAGLISLSHPTCEGSCNGSISVTGSGGTSPYTYSWSNGSTNSALNGLCEGTYSVTVSDAHGCTAAAEYVLNDIVLGLSFSSAPSCYAYSTDPEVLPNSYGTYGYAQAFPSGGTGPFSYLWSTGDNTDYIPMLAAGTYTCTITDANGCTIAGAVTIEDKAVTGYSIDNVTGVSCSGICNGSALLNISSGNPNGSPTYVWSTGDYNVTENLALCEGEQYCNVWNEHGCYQPILFLISHPGLNHDLQMEHTNISEPGLCDGTATVTVLESNETYEYFWSPANVEGIYQTTPTATGLCPGTYTVTVSTPFDPMNPGQLCSSAFVEIMGNGRLSSYLSSGNNETRYTLFPNPSTGIFSVAGEFTGEEFISIENLLGETVYASPVGGNASQVSVDISNLPSGTYVISVKSGSGVWVSKMIRQQ